MFFHTLCKWGILGGKIVTILGKIWHFFTDMCTINRIMLSAMDTFNFNHDYILLLKKIFCEGQLSTIAIAALGPDLFVQLCRNALRKPKTYFFVCLFPQWSTDDILGSMMIGHTLEPKTFKASSLRWQSWTTRAWKHHIGCLFRY